MTIVNLRMHADAEHPLSDESSSRGLSSSRWWRCCVLRGQVTDEQ